jgi:hypothetical protein
MTSPWILPTALLLSAAQLCLSTETASALTRNSALAEQVLADPERVLPRSEQYSLAVDGHTFYRSSEQFAGWYHSGYWADLLGEVRPFSTFSANARFVVYNPGASYGIVSETRIVPFMNFMWHDNLTNLGLFEAEASVRYFDRGRETIGAGLTIEEKEVSGITFELKRGDFRFTHYWNGTGGYTIDGDLVGLQYDYLQDSIGFYSFVTRGLQTLAIGLYSSREILDDLKLLAEISHRRSTQAGLIGIEYARTWKTFDGLFRAQYRRYQNGYADEIVGNIEHDYLSIEQEDKAFTNSANFFILDDDISVRSLLLNLAFRPAWWLRFFTENELTQLDYELFGQQDNYFYRHGAAICLRRNENLCANVFLSNRMTSADTHVEVQDRINKAFFRRQQFFAIEGRFRF